jgi:hypothetical protein
MAYSNSVDFILLITESIGVLFDNNKEPFDSVRNVKISSPFSMSCAGNSNNEAKYTKDFVTDLPQI